MIDGLFSTARDPFLSSPQKKNVIALEKIIPLFLESGRKQVPGM
jgi:hypothetical protein